LTRKLNKLLRIIPGAQDVLRNNLKGLTELAELLLEKEVIFSEDLERIFGKRKADILKKKKNLQKNKNP